MRWMLKLGMKIAKAIENNGVAQESYAAGGGEYDLTGMPELARRAAADGIVLLRNDGVLPLRPNDRIAVFGRCQVDTFYVGYGSGGDVNPPYRICYLDALESAEKRGALRLDGELAAIYREWCAKPKNQALDGFWGHWPMNYPEMAVSAPLAAECAARNDVAVVIIGRAAGEDRENTLTEGSYYLTKTEKKMLDNVTAAFAKTVVVMDCGNIVDMAWTEKYGDKLSAIVYAWQGGMESGNALADVLTGAAAPSGKLPDTIAIDYRDLPTAKNFGHKKACDYAEDIYVGYRYFETFAKERVLYPFGFGLTYTSFDVKCADVCYKDGALTAAVEVTNVGERPGREVVQMYLRAPKGRLGKAERSLVAFAKTVEIAPGETVTVTLKCTDTDMASYDDTGATGHNRAFVMERGEYEVFIGTDVRSARRCGAFELKETKVVKRTADACGVKVPFERIKSTDRGKESELVPASTTNLKERIEQNFPAGVDKSLARDVRLSDVAAGEATLDEFVAALTDEELEALTRGEGGMDSPQGTPGNAGIFGGTLPSLRGKGVLPIVTTDGPAGIRIKSYTTLLPCGTALGATWDEELIEKLYEKVGEEMVSKGSDLLLGPGMNIHRNPLCGRNFEYFSEDPLLTGRAAAAFVRGVQRSGRGACPKHFACNNQERNRTRVDSRVSERALREIYLRCFEICVAGSDPAAVMTSYNKINGVWNHYNYDLATTVLRGDWGYRGCVITDWWMRRSASPEFPKIEDNAYRVRAQVDVLMPGNMSRIKKEYESDGTLLATLGQEGGITRAEIERCAKNVLRCVLRLKYGASAKQ